MKIILKFFIPKSDTRVLIVCKIMLLLYYFSILTRVMIIIFFFFSIVRAKKDRISESGRKVAYLKYLMKIAILIQYYVIIIYCGA